MYFRNCESPHSGLSVAELECSPVPNGKRAISQDNKAFDDCVILSKDTFDPDAVFLEDIVDDDVLPYLSLEVDGLTTHEKAGKAVSSCVRKMLPLMNRSSADTTMPVATLDANALEVYGWESSLWKKIKGYLGF